MFKLVLIIIHALDLLVLFALIEPQFLLPVAHDLQLLLLQHLHPTDLQRPPAEDVQQRFNLVIEVEELIIPDLRLTTYSNALHILSYLFVHPVADHALLGQRLSLRGVLIPGRFVSQRLHELISEYFDVGPFVALKVAAGLLRLPDGLDGYLGPILIAILILLGDDDGGVGIAPEDPLIPHEIVVDQLSK